MDQGFFSAQASQVGGALDPALVAPDPLPDGGAVLPQERVGGGGGGDEGVERRRAVAVEAEHPPGVGEQLPQVGGDASAERASAVVQRRGEADEAGVAIGAVLEVDNAVRAPSYTIKQQLRCSDPFFVRRRLCR